MDCLTAADHSNGVIYALCIRGGEVGHSLPRSSLVGDRDSCPISIFCSHPIVRWLPPSSDCCCSCSPAAPPSSAADLVWDLMSPEPCSWLMRRKLWTCRSRHCPRTDSGTARGSCTTGRGSGAGRTRAAARGASSRPSDTGSASASASQSRSPGPAAPIMYSTTRPSSSAAS